jgi:hypothetical protein
MSDLPRQLFSKRGWDPIFQKRLSVTPQCSWRKGIANIPAMLANPRRQQPSDNEHHARTSAENSQSSSDSSKKIFGNKRATMRFIHILATIPTLVLCSQAFWTRLYNQFQLQAPAWLRIPIMTKLPLFIHDFRHPWIEQNIQWLERRPDPMNDLCAPDSALRNGDVEGYAIPSDLFARLEIDNNRYGINRAGWPNMQDRLKEIIACPVALQQVTYLYIDVYVPDGGWMDPGQKAIELMGRALSAMKSLRHLHWGIPSEANKYFSEGFAQQDLQLPSVKHLVVGAYAQYMVSVCPYLEKLEGGGYEHHWSWVNGPLDWDNNPANLLLHEASHAANITSFSFYNRLHHWDNQLVRGKII